MSDLVRDAKQEFWRPPLAKLSPEPAMAEACRRCGTEFMVGAAFCHICGQGRHRASVTPGESWTSSFSFLRALEFTSVRKWFGLPTASLCAFLLGAAFLIVALSLGVMSVHDFSDFEAIQLWRIQWLMAACAAFLAGILLKSRKVEN
jgi:ribosomal protein L37E